MIAEIRLKQYRSYLDKKFKFSEGVNIVVGPNASGKTNLLEAVMMICRGNSYRAPDSELIMHGKEWARLDAETDQGQRTLKLNSTPFNKEFLINNKSFKRLSAYNRLPIVLFEPNHLLMLSGSPELRRNYLDGILDLIRPGFKKTKNDYLKTLKQRNALLKNGSATMTDLFPWNIRLSHLGGLIAASRAELTIELNKSISKVYASLSNGKEKISLNYKANVDIGSYESQLLKKLESALELDLIRGFTTHGPHREDMEVFINSRPPSLVASRGESRTITIALKTLETEIVKRDLGVDPIVLMDDVFSELDTLRSRQLSGFLSNHQSIITTTDIHNHVAKEASNIIKIK